MQIYANECPFFFKACIYEHLKLGMTLGSSVNSANVCGPLHQMHEVYSSDIYKWNELFEFHFKKREREKKNEMASGKELPLSCQSFILSCSFQGGFSPKEQTKQNKTNYLAGEGESGRNPHLSQVALHYVLTTAGTSEASGNPNVNPYFALKLSLLHFLGWMVTACKWKK